MLDSLTTNLILFHNHNLLVLQLDQNVHVCIVLMQLDSKFRINSETEKNLKQSF